MFAWNLFHQFPGLSKTANIDSHEGKTKYKFISSITIWQQKLKFTATCACLIQKCEHQSPQTFLFLQSLQHTD